MNLVLQLASPSGILFFIVGYEKDAEWWVPYMLRKSTVGTIWVCLLYGSYWV